MIQSKDPTGPDLDRPLASLQGLDLTSADGRCGINSLLAEIERLSRAPSCNRRPGSSSGGWGVTLADYRDG